MILVTLMTGALALTGVAGVVVGASTREAPLFQQAELTGLFVLDEETGCYSIYGATGSRPVVFADHIPDDVRDQITARTGSTVSLGGGYVSGEGTSDRCAAQAGDSFEASSVSPE